MTAGFSMCLSYARTVEADELDIWKNSTTQAQRVKLGIKNKDPTRTHAFIYIKEGKFTRCYYYLLLFFSSN